MLNLAEGRARGGDAGRNHYLIAAGSEAEACACLDLVAPPRGGRAAAEAAARGRYAPGAHAVAATGSRKRRACVATKSPCARKRTKVAVCLILALFHSSGPASATISQEHDGGPSFLIARPNG